MVKSETIWFDGNYVPWDEAQVHVLTHTLHYGVGVFEGIRSYQLKSGGGAIFRLQAHIRRLFDSAKILTMEIPWSEEDIRRACVEVVRRNGLDACYIRPIAFLGDGAMGLMAKDNPVRVAIAAWKWGAYLGEEGLKKGVRAKISSFSRPAVHAQLSKSKAVGHYVNSILAKREVMAAGYDEAILLDPQGYISEASGENLFIVKDGNVVTPATGGSLLGGITRSSIIELLASLGRRVEERAITRDELYIADEAFFTGTAAEVTPVREVDDRTLGAGERGPLTQEVQDLFFEVAGGAREEWKDWLTQV